MYFRYRNNRDKRVVRMTFVLSHEGQGATLAAALKQRATDELHCSALHTHGDVLTLDRLARENPEITFAIGRNTTGLELLRMKFTELVSTEHARTLIDRMIDTARLLGIAPEQVKWELRDKPPTAIVRCPILRVRGRARAA